MAHGSTASSPELAVEDVETAAEMPSCSRANGGTSATNAPIGCDDTGSSNRNDEAVLESAEKQGSVRTLAKALRRQFHCCPPEPCQRCACCCGSCLSVIIVLGVAAALYLSPRQPQWELTNLRLEVIKVPGIFAQGIAVADTSECPSHDPCGVVTGNACSRCPHDHQYNRGCICTVANPGTRAAPGTVIMADTTACPVLDKCGLSEMNRGCPVCPDGTWINDGCTCRQPLSTDEFFSGLNDFIHLTTGQDKFPIEIQLQADVEVHNPNNLGADTEEGSVALLWKGIQFGESSVPPLHMQARSKQVIHVQVDVNQLTSGTGLRLLADTLQNRGLLTVEAAGTISAKGPFGILVQTGVSCKVTTDLFDSSKIVNQQCEYTYDV